MNNIPLFFSYYHEYPDHDPDNLFEAIYLLIACNCEDLIIKLLKDIYPYIFYSSNVIGADEFVIPILISKYSPYLKPDFTEVDIESLVNNLKELDSEISEMKIITEKKYWEKILRNMFITTPDFGYYKEQGKLKDYYDHIFWNFKAYLHNDKNRCWITAHYYSKSIYDYLLRKIEKKKKQKTNFVFDEKEMENYILKYYKDFFEIKPIAALMFLQAVCFFAEYLQKLNIIAIQDKKDIENNCMHLYDKIYKVYLDREYGVRIFENFKLDPR